jgi:hypothetical protein
MLTINDFAARLSAIFEQPIGPITEIKRALIEQTKAFNEDDLFEEYFGAEGSAQAVRDVRSSSFPQDVLAGKAGPGGGVKVDYFRAGFFTLAVALDNPRSETAEKIWLAWHLPQQGSVLSGWGEDWKPTFATCKLTGTHLFGHAFESIIRSAKIAARVQKVRVDTSGAFAEIKFDKGETSTFTHQYQRGPLFLRKVVEIDGQSLQLIATMLEKK